jgi:hypothetical protein
LIVPQTAAAAIGILAFLNHPLPAFVNPARSGKLFADDPSTPTPALEGKSPSCTVFPSNPPVSHM